ncbi:MAG: hypothetical protein K8U03_22505 [Planctomycetia bacterium]|nr:hypothetical protein [Planctomycetia bacterium]
MCAAIMSPENPTRTSLKLEQVCVVAAFLSLALVCSAAKGEQTENGRTDQHLYASKMSGTGSMESVSWRDCVSRQVEAQGIAWGGLVKPLRPYVILDGERVFIVGKLLPAEETEGRLVQVRGIMNLQKHAPAPPGFQQHHTAMYYFILVGEMKLIDRIEHTCIRVIP